MATPLTSGAERIWETDLGCFLSANLHQELATKKKDRCPSDPVNSALSTPLTSSTEAVWGAEPVCGEDLSSLLPVGFHELREELEKKKERCPLPDLARSSLWARRAATNC
uniref:Uncharacterized protein n=1 Tax=Noctiluca scintillans TaxID=2966 RepID=A0A7S1F881_NOCSC